MTALELAERMGVDPDYAEDYLSTCARVVESSLFVALLKEDHVHIAADISGLGGRQLLRECKAVLADWFDVRPVLFAPVRYGNERAVKLAEALGFRIYARTDTHIWLMQTKEQFHAKPH